MSSVDHLLASVDQARLALRTTAQSEHLLFRAGVLSAGTAFACSVGGKLLLRGRLSEGAMSAYETSAQIHQFQSLVIMVLACRPEATPRLARQLFLLGLPLTCGPLYWLSLTEFRQSEPILGYVKGLRPMDLGLVAACMIGSATLLGGWVLALKSW